MSMHVCGQTLVLVDNDATVSEVNQKLVKATLKYMFYHMPEDRTFCLNTYEHDISLDEEYISSVEDLVCAADNMEYAQKDSNLADTLCQVITRWKEADFACRDIVVFTDGLEGAATDHEKEELYYLAQNSEYPVYIVYLEQEDNAAAKKSLSATAVTSGGKLFETEYEGSEAGVDRQITESIFAAMDEYARVHWARYEEPEETKAPAAGKVEGTATDAATEEPEEATDEASEETSDEEPVTEDVDTQEYMASAPYDEKVIYEYDRETGFFGGTGALILSASLIAAGLIAGIGGGFVIMKKRRAPKTAAPKTPPAEEDFFDDYELKGIGTTDLPYEEEGDTTFLADIGTYDGATRLLGADAATVVLTEEGGADRTYRIVLSAPMTIGRGMCDVTIKGDDALSKKHCELYEKDGKVFVRDLSSSNGTRINGVRCDERMIEDGDELAIGARCYKVNIL